MSFGRWQSMAIENKKNFNFKARNSLQTTHVYKLDSFQPNCRLACNFLCCCQPNIFPSNKRIWRSLRPVSYQHQLQGARSHLALDKWSRHKQAYRVPMFHPPSTIFSKRHRVWSWESIHTKQQPRSMSHSLTTWQFRWRSTVDFGNQHLKRKRSETVKPIASSRLTNTFGNISTPRAALFAGDERFANNLVTTLTSVFGERTDFVSLNRTRRVLMRSDQSSSVHSVVACHWQNAVGSKNRLGASDLLALRRRIAPLTRLEASSLCNTVQSVRVCTTVSHFGPKICCVLKILGASKWNRS